MATFATLPLPIAALGVKVGPDGCVYNASTSLSEVPGAFVWRMCEVGSGSDPTPRVFVSDTRLRGADGIVFDRSGALLVTVNASDTLVSLDRRARVSVLQTGGLLDAPSSVAFGATAADKHTLYLTIPAYLAAPGATAHLILARALRHRSLGSRAR